MGAIDPVGVVLFDGVCNLCNSSVQFIIRRDPRARIYFAALQSEYGRAQIKKFNLPPDKLYSVMFIKNGQLRERSNAALEIARHLSGFWPAFYFFKIIPRFMRDALYDFIAANRYKWFGKKDECMIPTPELKGRFLG